MGDPSTYRSWKGPATDEEAAAERRRERVRSWVRPASVIVVLAVIVVDALVVVIASGVMSGIRVRSGRACSTFWTGLAHDISVGLWILLALVVVTLLVALRRRWVFVAVLAVQLIVLAILVPIQVHKRNQFLGVADGRLSAVQVDTGGVACT